MKPYCIAAVAVLFFAFCSVGLGQASPGPRKCCFSFFKAKIPKTIISHYETTSPDCTNPGVIFHTMKQMQICVNPFESWVSDALNFVEKRMIGEAVTSGSGTKPLKDSTGNHMADTAPTTVQEETTFKDSTENHMVDTAPGTVQEETKFNLWCAV